MNLASESQVLTRQPQERERKRMVHYERPGHRHIAWCGAPVLGIRYRPGEGPGVDCVVCVDLWNGRRK